MRVAGTASRRDSRAETTRTDAEYGPPPRPGKRARGVLRRVEGDSTRAETTGSGEMRSTVPRPARGSVPGAGYVPFRGRRARAGAAEARSVPSRIGNSEFGIVSDEAPGDSDVTEADAPGRRRTLVVWIIPRRLRRVITIIGVTRPVRTSRSVVRLKDYGT